MTGTQDLAPDLAPVVACLLITARGHGVDVLLSPDMTTIGGLLDAARLASLRLADDVVVWLDRDAQLRRWRPPNPAVSRLAWALGVIVLAPGGVFGPALVADPRGQNLAGRVLTAWAAVAQTQGGPDDDR